MTSTQLSLLSKQVDKMVPQEQLHEQQGEQDIVFSQSGMSQEQNDMPPTMIELAHRIQDDDIDSISDCSSCGDDDEMDIQPIPVGSDDWRNSAGQAIVVVAKPVFQRQTSIRSVVPSIISFEADEEMDDDELHEDSFCFPEGAVANCLPRLVDRELDMDDRSIATFSLAEEERERAASSLERNANQCTMAC